MWEVTKLLWLTSIVLGQSQRRFDNFHAFRLPAESSLLTTPIGDSQFNILGKGSSGIDILVGPKRLEWFRNHYSNYTLLHKNFQQVLEEERKSSNPLKLVKEITMASIDYFERYHDLDEMMAWYQNLATTFSDMVTYIPSIGKSHEGRDLIALKINGRQTASFPNKVQIYMQSLIHAREWITGITVQYIIEQFLMSYGNDTVITDILDQAELIVVPIVNPDGYTYSWKSDRLWRKNRNNTGVDLNRNWGEHWGQERGAGDPDSNIYAGVSPFSEQETKVVSKFILSQQRIVGALDFHSYSEYFLRPVGWSLEDQPHEKEHLKLCKMMSKAVWKAHHRAKYVCLKSAENYFSTGLSRDWFYGQEMLEHQGFRPFAFTVELSPSKDLRHIGFVLPPRNIIPVGKDMIEAVKVFAVEAIQHRLVERKKID